MLTFINSEGQKVSKFYQEINGKRTIDHSGARARKALEESGMEKQGGGRRSKVLLQSLRALSNSAPITMQHLQNYGGAFKSRTLSQRWALEGPEDSFPCHPSLSW